jgi:capsular polysaccharide biosynthesis protein
MDQSKKDTLIEDEIDLYELWLVIKRRKTIILLTLIAVFLFAILYVSFTEKIYTVENYLAIPNIVVNNNNNNNNNLISLQDVSSLIERVSKQDKDFYLVFLKFSNEEYDALKKISASVVKGGTSIKISIDLTEPKLADNILQKLSAYLNDVDLFKKAIALTKERLEKDRAAILENIKTYDMIIKKLRENGKESLYLGFDPSQSLLASKSRLVLIENTLKNFQQLAQFSYIQKTFIPSKPSKPKKMLILVVSIVTGSILGVLIAFFKEWIETAKKKFEEISKN